MCFNDEEYNNYVIRAPIYTPTKENAFSEPTRVTLSPARLGRARPARSDDFTPKLKLLPGPIGRDGPMPSGETSLHTSFTSLRARSGEDARFIVRSSARSGEMAQSHRAKTQIHQTAQFRCSVAGPIGHPCPTRSGDYLFPPFDAFLLLRNLSPPSYTP